MDRVPFFSSFPLCCQHNDMLLRSHAWKSHFHISIAVLKRAKHSHARSIAVIGSGISGLTTTLKLARQLLPGGKHRIVLYDSDQRPGGWVRSDRVQVNGKGEESARCEASALVEAGPRSLRPAGLPGLAMLDLVSIRFTGHSYDLVYSFLTSFNGRSNH